MACVNIITVNDDSEREEGEIVDDFDELSDISSEEEFLLRQRLQVLENYNHVLERKKAKRTSFGSGYTTQNDNLFIQELSEISGTELEDNTPHSKKELRLLNPYHKQRKTKESEQIITKREHKKKAHRSKRKEVKVISDSSDESDDEYRNKRRKLAEAVSINITKNDPSSLKARLKKMLCGNQEPTNIQMVAKNVDLEKVAQNVNNCSPISSLTTSSPTPELDQENENLPKELTDEIMACEDLSKKILSQEVLEDPTKITKLIELCTEDKVIHQSVDTVDSIEPGNKTEKLLKSDSDEDLELLRQHALKTKTSKKEIAKKCTIREEEKLLESSEGEDSDTVELRMICLKSALLKRAIEMKQKQKLQKRLSQSSNLHDDVMADQDELFDKIDSGNNTDIESVDMDIVSEGEDKDKDPTEELDMCKILNEHKSVSNSENIHNIPRLAKSNKADEVEEDEDLLRAKLLISLSKNLPNLVDPDITNDLQKVPEESVKKSVKVKKPVVSEEKKFIINIGDSDSEGEHEATKNLTKMHMKLSEQVDFQQKLDMFLKSTRMEVEKNTNVDVVQKPNEVKPPPSPKPAEKFVPKAVRHLPKSEQIEYKNLVKRMAELEKIKITRQSSIASNNNSIAAKAMLKPKNFSIERNKMPAVDIEEQIALSRKKIAEESAKVLQLKEEAKKLSQKYKIVATELRNLNTAITLNKKEQRAAQMRLSKVRADHQVVLKSSKSKHSIVNGQALPLAKTIVKPTQTAKLQKENNPSKKEDYKIPHMQRSVKVSVINDLNDSNPTHPRLSVQVDLTSNKKIVKIPKDRTIGTDLSKTEGKSNLLEDDYDKSRQEVPLKDNDGKKGSRDDDYTSPLQALGKATWDADPNAILCPFEVGGNCKDADCKYFHPKPPSEQ